MKKVVLTQEQVDKLVVADRRAVEPSVLGVGVVDVPFKIRVGGVLCWQYQLWSGMLGRCFNESFKETNPTYMNVTCCGEWFSFGSFLEWVNKEVDYSGKPDGMQLDKDILQKGNLIYAPEKCCFVPRVVNLLLTDRARRRGRWPLGVVFHKGVGKFVATVRCNGKIKHLGYFDNPEDASQAYKVAKEAHIKVVALEHREVLKPAVFQSLVNWEII